MTAEDIIGRDALLALEFAGFKVVACDAQAVMDVGDDDFAALWKEWPNKTAKPEAQKAYRAARKRGHSHGAILEGMRRYVATKPPDRPWLHFSTFCNQERFLDAPAAVIDPRGGLGDYKQNLRQEIANGLAGHQGGAGGNGGTGMAAIAHYRR